MKAANLEMVGNQIHFMYREIALRQPSGIDGITYFSVVEDELNAYLAQGWRLIGEPVMQHVAAGSNAQGFNEPYVRVLFTLYREQ